MVSSQPNLRAKPPARARGRARRRRSAADGRQVALSESPTAS